MKDLPQEAVEARRAYWRKYYQEHKAEANERLRRYWIKKAAAATDTQTKGSKTDDEER